MSVIILQQLKLSISDFRTFLWISLLQFHLQLCRNLCRLFSKWKNLVHWNNQISKDLGPLEEIFQISLLQQENIINGLVSWSSQNSSEHFASLTSYNCLSVWWRNHERPQLRPWTEQTEQVEPWLSKILIKVTRVFSSWPLIIRDFLCLVWKSWDWQTAT